jgi:hypothetical protein
LEQDGSDLHEEIKLKAFPYKNYGPQLSIADRKCSLVRSKKNAKIADRNFWAGSANLQF